MKEILPFCRDLPEVALEAGAVVLEEHGKTGQMFVLLDGAVEVLKGDVPVSVVDDPGAVFGEMAALLGLPHSATVKTLQDSRFYVVDDGAGFLADHPEVATRIARLLARRLHAMTTYLADIKRQFAEQSGQLGIIDEVLASLAHDQDETEALVSDRDPDTQVD